MLFCTSDPSARLEIEAKMKADKLPVLKRPKEPKAKVPKEPQDRERKKLGFQGSQSTGNNQPEEIAGPSLEDLVQGSERFRPRDVEELVEQWGAPEEKLADMPMADQPKNLQAQLLPYQRQVSWHECLTFSVTLTFPGIGLDAGNGKANAAASGLQRSCSTLETHSYRLIHQYCYKFLNII
jgi:hypothetical protein